MDMSTRAVPYAGDTCFFTLIVEPQQESHARLLIESLRAFGGRLCGCPLWVLYVNEPAPDPQGWGSRARVQFVPLTVERAIGYWFSAKVHACARAEELAGPEVRSLVWLAPESLIVQPPLLFELGADDASPDALYAGAIGQQVVIDDETVGGGGVDPGSWP